MLINKKLLMLQSRLVDKFAKFRYFILLWQCLRPRRRRQLIGLQVLSVLSAIGEVANLGALLPFLRLLANPAGSVQFIGPLSTPLHQLPQSMQLLTLGLGFVCIVIISTLLRALTIRSQLRLVALITADLAETVFAELLTRPFSWHVQHNSSKILAYLTNDVEQVAGSIQALLLFLINLCIVLLLGATLVALSPEAMPLLAVLLASFYALVFKFTRATLKFDGEKLSSNYQRSIQAAQEALGGIRDVILDQSQSFFLDSYRDPYRNYRLASASINTKAQIPRYLIEGFVVILIVSFSLGCAFSGIDLNQQLPLLGIMVMGSYRLLQPLQQCFNSVSALQAQQASFQRLGPFLQSSAALAQLETQSLSIPLDQKLSAPLLQFSQVSYRYTANSPLVLNQFDLSIQSGERIAFVGSSGSGKSTSCDLILGLLRPTEGKILINGIDLHCDPANLARWQRRIAHVPQHIYLSDASFAANIAFGVPLEQIDYDRLLIAAHQAQIAELIEASENGYSTIVGERGVRLSGGQRQRIGLARALYKNAELLVLDEATSALDNRTENEVMQAIAKLDRQITVIMIAHRLSTVKQCDRLLLMDHGKLAAIGTYEQLVATNATFRGLAYMTDTSQS